MRKSAAQSKFPKKAFKKPVGKKFAGAKKGFEKKVDAGKPKFNSKK